jgi:hypothetical protein
MKTMFATGLPLVAAAAVLLGSASLALAVSDGNYSPARQHCSGHADNTATPDYTEDGCQAYALTVSDYGGHEYFGWGIPQTKVGEQGFIPPGVIPFGTGDSTHVIAYWTDPGPPQGCVYTKIDLKTQQQTQEACPWFNTSAPNYNGPDVPPNSQSGLRLYNGADDNLAGGEHDSATSVGNGPSDGGAIQLNLNLDPATLMAWMANLMTVPNLLTHPLPLFDAGIGLCADGFCMSTQTTRRDQAYPGGNPNHYPVADYSHHTFDPYKCSNDDAECIAQPNDFGRNAEDWNNFNGDPSIEPGVQIYEDPDAQGSPIGPVYPIPAVYVGTCGVIIGGGRLCSDFGMGSCPSSQVLGPPPTTPAAPGAPYVNDAGQLVIPTGCN